MTKMSGTPRSLPRKEPLEKVIRLKVRRFSWPGSPDVTSGIVQNIRYASVTADTTYSTFYVERAFDGSTGLGYHSGDSGDAWAKLDFGDWRVNITHWGMYCLANGGQHTPYQFNLEVSNDESSWRTIYTNTSVLPVSSWSSGAVETPNAGWYRYARIWQPAGGSSSGSSYIYFGELEFWGNVLHAKDYELLETS